MPYYNRDPKRDPNFDNHPYVLQAEWGFKKLQCDRTHFASQKPKSAGPKPMSSKDVAGPSAVSQHVKQQTLNILQGPKHYQYYFFLGGGPYYYYQYSTMDPKTPF